MIHDHCVVCGAPDNLYQHHLVPWSAGGSDNEANLITLYGECHGKAHGVKSISPRTLTIAALRRKKAKRELVGGLPYGYTLADDGKTLIENPTEQSIIAQAKELHAASLSLRRVSAALNARGLYARNGHPFSAVRY